MIINAKYLRNLKRDYYKAVYADWAKPDTGRSIAPHSPDWCLEYRLNKVTCCIPVSAGIFIFDTFMRAEQFATSMWSRNETIIFRVKAYSVKPLPVYETGLLNGTCCVLRNVSFSARRDPDNPEILHCAYTQGVTRDSWFDVGDINHDSDAVLWAPRYSLTALAVLPVEVCPHIPSIFFNKGGMESGVNV